MFFQVTNRRHFLRRASVVLAPGVGRWALAFPPPEPTLEVTPRRSWRVGWAGGSAEINLLPMNAAALEGNQYQPSPPKGPVMRGLADAVGIIGLHLEGGPAVPRICWDSREHQLWRGFLGGFELRNVLLHSPQAVRRPDGSVEVSGFFVANDVRTSMHWRFPALEVSDSLRAQWDTLIQVESLRSEPLPGYLQVFACYHPPGQNYYWDSGGTLQACAPETFFTTGTEEEAERFLNSEWINLFRYYRKERQPARALHRRPVLVSEPRPWYAGLRHLVLVDPSSCACMMSANAQARDYWIRPPGDQLSPGGSFTTRVRHLIARVDGVIDLHRYWSAFERDLGDLGVGVWGRTSISNLNSIFNPKTRAENGP